MFGWICGILVNHASFLLFREGGHDAAEVVAFWGRLWPYPPPLHFIGDICILSESALELS
jgi:hypothetical protein